MLFGSFTGDFIAVLFFVAAISLAGWVFRRPVHKTSSFVLGSVSLILLLLSVLYFLVRFIQPHLSQMH
jgi:hypothetical protein